MAKRVFFSFHYQDVIDFRANVVRQYWLTKPNSEAAGGSPLPPRHAPTAHAWASKQPSLRDCHSAYM